MPVTDVVIIGAGAAGLMCAFTAAARGRKVMLIDHANKPGKKILMSGGGRCNFTNMYTEPANFLSQNPHFCKSALARYTQWDFIAMVARHGVPYHEKKLGQLFCDNKSSDILEMLLEECRQAGVSLHMDTAVQQIEKTDAGYSLQTTLSTLNCQSLVIATGGLSIPTLGATGFGYQVGKQFGHTLLPTRAGLVPLTLSGKHQERLADLSGVALPVEARCNGKSFQNFMLLTHRGVSGPAILQISSFWQPGDALELDLLPGQDAGEWLRQMKRERPAAELRTVLGDVMPKRLAQRLCEHWLPDRPVRQLDEPVLRQAAQLLGAFPLVASGTEGYRTAEVTLGGVDTAEVSSSTLESKRVPGLHFVGEVLDVTGW
ncbi:NAD(P)/FAD-dependent oxidoreductase, partial [Pseudomonas syringae]|uniref:NAD(P)/FAD-dependent oxidoreductase n=1 Tax=Pseudomonas syringae TaxID=317 RepID=UPI0013C2B8FC